MIFFFSYTKLYYHVGQGVYAWGEYFSLPSYGIFSWAKKKKIEINFRHWST